MKPGPITKRIWKLDGEEHVWRVAWRFEIVLVVLLVICAIGITIVCHCEAIPVAK
jgi:hypothetical protein